MKPDKISISLGIVMSFTTFSWISSCTHKTDTANIPEICYKDVETIVGAKCSLENCHDGNSEAIRLTSYDDILKVVNPYDADKSPMYKAITSVRGENQMPPDQPLAEESRTIIRFWIEQGAKDSTENSSLCRSVPAAARAGYNNLKSK